MDNVIVNKRKDNTARQTNNTSHTWRGLRSDLVERLLGGLAQSHFERFMGLPQEALHPILLLEVDLRPRNRGGRRFARGLGRRGGGRLVRRLGRRGGGRLVRRLVRRGGRRLVRRNRPCGRGGGQLVRRLGRRCRPGGRMSKPPLPADGGDRGQVIGMV